MDFVITRGDKTVAIKVKSGHRQMNSGLAMFRERFHTQYSMVVGGSAMPLDVFFNGNLEKLL